MVRRKSRPATLRATEGARPKKVGVAEKLVFPPSHLKKVAIDLPEGAPNLTPHSWFPAFARFARDILMTGAAQGGQLPLEKKPASPASLLVTESLHSRVLPKRRVLAFLRREIRHWPTELLRTYSITLPPPNCGGRISGNLKRTR